MSDTRSQYSVIQGISPPFHKISGRSGGWERKVVKQLRGLAKNLFIMLLHTVHSHTVRKDHLMHRTTKSSVICFTGPGACAGRSLAQLEMRLVVAELIRRFDMNFGSNMTLEQWEVNLLDRFTLMRGALWVKLQQRSQ
jgi:hypothetical protein